MSKLLPIVIFALIMAFFSDQMSVRYIDHYGCKAYRRKEFICYFIMAVAMAVFVGLRTRGNDTYAYRQMFENISAGTEGFRSIEWSNFSVAPGLQYVEVVLKTLGATAQDYFMVTGFFVTFTYLAFIKKYSTDIWLTTFFFIAMGCYTFSMAAIKQTMAVAFLVIATDCAIQKKWISYCFWLCIAELFHPYAFVYLVVPFLSFSPWSNKSYFLLAATVLVSLFLPYLFGAIGDVNEALGYGEDYGNFMGDGVNVFRVLVVWVTVVISYLGRQDLCKSQNRAMNIIVNLAMMNAVIMFIGLFGTANYFARLANYFLIFQVLALPWLFRYIKPVNRGGVRFLSVFFYSLYFYYSTVLANGRFDSHFNFLSFFDYLARNY